MITAIASYIYIAIIASYKLSYSWCVIHCLFIDIMIFALIEIDIAFA